jgi:hypothetical protein
VHDADDNGEFHLKAILDCKNVVCVKEPCGVESERIDTAVLDVVLVVSGVLGING